MTSHRAQLAAALKPHLPDTWRIVPAQRNVDFGNKVTLLVKQRSYVRLAQAPASHLTIEFVLTLVSKHQDIDRAEDELDELLPDLLPLLETSKMRWESATKVEVDGNRLGYDIILHLVTPKETP